MTLALLTLSAISIVVSASSSESECDPSSLLQTTVKVDRTEAAGPFSENFDRIGELEPLADGTEAAGAFSHYFDHYRGGELEALPDELQRSVDPKSSEALLSMLDDLADFERRTSFDLSMLNSSNSSNGTGNLTNETSDTAAELTGVSANSDSDWITFLAGLATNVVTIIITLVIFLLVRRPFEEVFEGNVVAKIAPVVPGVQKGMFDWVRNGLGATSDQIQDTVGLDVAMLLEFCDFGISVFAQLSIPIFLCMAPLNLCFGGFAAGKDYLSYLSIGNVEEGSWVYWVDCVTVWIVVLIVQINIYRAMEKMVQHRLRWLKELPSSRANTIIVENIPEEYQSDSQLKAFFEVVFGRGSVRFAETVKICPGLTALCAKRDQQQKDLEAVKRKFEKGQATDRDVAAVQSVLDSLEPQIRAKRQDVLAVARTPGAAGMNTESGFVQFYRRRDAELATGAQFSVDIDTWNVAAPPPASTILWDSFKVSHGTKTIKKLIGYALVAGLYVGYLPIVVLITEIGTSINMGPLQPVWASLAPTLGLTVMVSMLPTFLILIFDTFFTLPDSWLAQEMLQNWYFIFQVVFVLLVTAIGSSVVEFTETLVTDPFAIFTLLGEKLPDATHFYMNYLVLQWTTHFMSLLRTSNWGKYIVFKHVLGYPNAKELSEPEDQDYYGIGSRSARFSIVMCIGIVYGTMSPPITVLTLITMAIMRLVYGYLLPFAEIKKADLGGSFFVHQMNEVYAGNMLYCIAMSGVLLGRVTSKIPGLIAASSIFYVVWSYQRFNRKFVWERIPVADCAEDKPIEEHQHQPGRTSVASLSSLYQQCTHPATLGHWSGRQEEAGSDEGHYQQPEFFDKK